MNAEAVVIEKELFEQHKDVEVISNARGSCCVFRRVSCLVCLGDRHKRGHGSVVL